MLVTRARSKATSSDNARLVPLDDVAFDAEAQAVGVDDQPAIMRHGEFARPDFAAAAVDLDLGDDRDERTRALGTGDPAPGQSVAIAVGPRATSAAPTLARSAAATERSTSQRPAGSVFR